MQTKKQPPTMLTGEDLRTLRMSMGMSLKDFWGAAGYSLSRGCAYETGKTDIPGHVRRLMYLQYVLGIPTDIDSQEFRDFEAALKSNNPVQLNNARKALESGIDFMHSALTELKK